MVDNHQQFNPNRSSQNDEQAESSKTVWWLIAALIASVVISLGVPNLNPRTNYPTCVGKNTKQTDKDIKSCNKSFGSNKTRTRSCVTKALRDSKRRASSCRSILVKGNDRLSRVNGLVSVAKANRKSLELNKKVLTPGVCSVKDVISWKGCFKSLNEGSANVIEVVNSFRCSGVEGCNVQVSNIKGPAFIRGAANASVGITRTDGYKDPIISILASQDIFLNGLTLDDQKDSSCKDCSSPMVAIINSFKVNLSAISFFGSKRAAIGIAGSDSVTLQGSFIGDGDGAGVLIPYAPSQNIQLSSNIQLLGNTFNNLRDVGLVVSSQNTRFSGNMLSGVKTGIIFNDPAKFLEVSSNLFTNIADQNIGHGIQANTEEIGKPNFISDVVIKNNRFINLGGWAIYRNSKNPPECKNISISDNLFERVRCSGDPSCGLLKSVFWSCRCEDIGLKSGSLIKGTVNSTYSDSLATRLGVDYTYRVMAGSLPNGLALEPWSGAISGKPTTPGVYVFSVTLNTPTICADSRDYTIEVTGATAPKPENPKPGDPAPKPAVCNESSIRSGPAVEGIYGVPSDLAEIFSFVTYPPECSKSAKILCPTGYSKIGEDQQLPGGANRQLLCRKDCNPGQISAPAVGYRGRPGLPSGLPDSGYKRFRFITFPIECSGNSQTLCPASFTPYQGENGEGVVKLPTKKLQRNCEISCQPPELRSGGLPNTKLNTEYQQSLTTTSGNPLIFSMTGGALPPGMYLSSSGVISGKATKEGTYSFTVYAEDQNGCSTTRAFAIIVESATCPAGYADCDRIGDNGCETNIEISPDHCGTCGNKCSFPNGFGSCWKRGCILHSCAEGYASCDGVEANGCETRRETFTSDIKNCGGSGKVCDDGYACTTDSCDNGQCKFTPQPRKEDDTSYPGYKIIYYCAAEQGIQCPEGYSQEGPFNMEGFPEGRQINCRKK